MENKIAHPFKRTLLSFVFGIGIVVVMMLYYQVSRIILSYIPPLIEKLIMLFFSKESGPERLPSFVLTPIDLRLERVASPDISSNRIEMWLYGLGLLKQNFLFGIEPFYLNSILLNEFNMPHIHNTYVEILVGNGIIGLASFLSAIVYYLIQSIKYLIMAKDKINNYLINCMLFSFATALLVTGLVECHILYWSAILFFIMACQMCLIHRYNADKRIKKQTVRTPLLIN